MTKDDRIEVTKKLRRYARWDDSELGETCLLLVELAINPALLSDGFVDQLDKEIVLQLNNFLENSALVEKKESRDVVYKVVEWHDKGDD